MQSMECLALTLLVLRVNADYHDLALAANDFAFFANRLYGWSYFHGVYLQVLLVDYDRGFTRDLRPHRALRGNMTAL